MPKLSFWLFLSLFTASVILLGFKVKQVSPADYEEYESFFNNPQETPKEVIQERKGGRKDFWISKNDTRYHHAMISPFSLLHITSLQPDLDAKEHLKDLKIFLQESISTKKEEASVQEVRLLEAKKGVFDYKTKALAIKQVEFFNYMIEGEKLPLSEPLKDPYVAGKALSARIHLKDQKPEAQADRIRATIFRAKKASS